MSPLFVGVDIAGGENTWLACLAKDGFRNWVASFNSLMAVPIRARMLAEGLSPAVATILETHPRASMYFGSDGALDRALRDYKNGPDPAGHVDALWRAWCARFGIEGALGRSSDGPLDSAVCATVAYLSHHRPEDLLRLRHTANDKTGRGPFYVVSPRLRRPAGGA